MSTPTEPTKRFQCRHILTDGHRCGSPALKQEIFCYYHHTTRKPIPKTEAQDRKGRHADFDLPLPEDRSAIQHAIGEILRRIANHGIDPRRAGLLLYGLQIASLNLPRQATPSEEGEPAEMVEEIVQDPVHGTLAPEAELPEERESLTLGDLLLREFCDPDPITPTTTVPTLRACRPHYRKQTAHKPRRHPATLRRGRSLHLTSMDRRLCPQTPGPGDAQPHSSPPPTVQM